MEVTIKKWDPKIRSPPIVKRVKQVSIGKKKKNMNKKSNNRALPQNRQMLTPAPSTPLASSSREFASPGSPGSPGSPQGIAFPTDSWTQFQLQFPLNGIIPAFGGRGLCVLKEITNRSRVISLKFFLKKKKKKKKKKKNELGS
mgnify:CR=1 FL=1